MAVAEKESVSCPYPDEKTRRFPESRRRRNPFCRRRADSKSKAAVVVGKSVYILPGEHRLEMAGYTLRHQLSNIPSFQVRESSRNRRSDLPAAGAIYSAMNRRAESLK